MEIKNLLKEMNDLLVTGLKVFDAEKKLGYAEGTARRKLVDAGYKYSRRDKKYILKEVEQTKEKKINNQMKLKDGETVVTGSGGVIPSQKKENEVMTRKEMQTFTLDQVDVLRKIIREYQIRERVQQIPEEEKGKTINRNVRVYAKQFDIFADWCKENNLTQADGLYEAINMLMGSL